MSFCKISILSAFLVSGAAVAQADVPLGLWKSAPDRSGLVVHVRTKPCGDALCGRVERTKDRRGYDTPSSFVGRKIVWDMVPQGDGSYSGRLWEPARNRMLDTRMQVQGNRMKLHACDGDSCRDEVWTRLR